MIASRAVLFVEKKNGKLLDEFFWRENERDERKS
jgi:hypothetical protein